MRTVLTERQAPAYVTGLMASEVLNKLEDALGVFTVLSKAKMRVRTCARWVETPCPDPSCGCAAHIVGRGIVCTSVMCNFRVGDVFSYLSLVWGVTTLEVLNRLREMFTEVMEVVDNTHTFESYAPSVANSIDARAATLRFLLDRRGARHDLGIQYQQAAEWIDSKGVQLEASPCHSFLLTAGEMREYVAILNSYFDTSYEYTASCPALVVPNMWDFLSLSHVMVIQVSLRNGKDPWHLWHLAPSRVSFAGLLGCRGGSTGEICVTSGHQDMLTLTATAHEFAVQANYVSLSFVPGAVGDCRLQFANPRYLMAAGEDLTKLSMLRPLWEEFEVGRVESPWLSVPFSEFLRVRARDFMQAGNIEAIRRDIQTMALTDEELEVWKEYLVSQGNSDVLEFVNKATAKTRDSWEVRGAVIFETEEGYQVAKGGAERRQATNFTFSFSKNVFFPNRAELWHLGVLRFQKESYPIIVKREALMKARDMERAASLAVACARLKGKDAHTPMVHDNNLAASLPLLFSMLTATLPRLEGLNRLGWSDDRSSFQGPGWAVEKDEILLRESCADPESVVLRRYLFSAAPTFSAPTSPPAWAAELAVFLVAQAARVMKGRPAHPVLLMDSKEAQVNLKKTFLRAFGQKEMVTLAYNQRGGHRDIDQLTGYPCLASGELPPANKSTAVPFVLLGDAGRSIDTTENTEEGIAFVADAFRRCVRWMVKTAGDELKFRTSVLSEQDMLTEGVEWIFKATGTRVTFDRPPMPVWSQAIRSVSRNQVAGVFRKRFEEQKMVIRLAFWSDEIKTLLAAELARADIGFKAENDKYVTVDLSAGYDMLAGAFGKAPDLGDAKAKMDDMTWFLEAAL